MNSRASETDFYAVLGVSPGASAPEIKESYRRMVRLHHPDANPNHREQCERRMKAIIEAYTTLGDPLRRERYDAETRLQAWEVKTSGSGKKMSATASTESLITRVRNALDMTQTDMAERLGLSEGILQEMEQRDDVPKTPIQLRTFTLMCENAAEQLEKEGYSSFAHDIRTLLARKKSQRAFFR